MTDKKLKVGQQVRIRRSQRIYEIVELDPSGVGEPAHPSTYLARIKPTDGHGVDQVYGNAALDRIYDR